MIKCYIKIRKLQKNEHNHAYLLFSDKIRQNIARYTLGYIDISADW